MYPYVTDFGRLQNNTTKTDTIVLVNPYKFTVAVDSLWLQPPNTSFSIVGESVQLPDSLPAGDTIQLYVKFSSGNDSTFTGDTVMVKFYCFSRPLAVLDGGSGKPCVSVNNLDFGILAINPKTNVAQADSSVAIINFGTDTLFITNLTIVGSAGGDFANTPMPKLPDTLAPGEKEILVPVLFSATATGIYTDSLIISSNANAVCADSVAALTAAVVAPGARTGYNWGLHLEGCQFIQDSAITIMNVGTSSDSLVAMNIIGGDSTAFIQNPPHFPLPLPANQTEMIGYMFVPNDTGNLYEYVELIFAQSPPIIDTLEGVGILPILSSQNINFGAQKIGQTTDSFAVVLNVPKQFGGALQIYGIYIEGGDSSDFTLPDASLTDTMNATGDTIHVMVDFSPTAGGARNSELCFEYNGGAGCSDTTICYTLQGIGVAPALFVDNWNAGRVFITTTHDEHVVDS